MGTCLSIKIWNNISTFLRRLETILEGLFQTLLSGTYFNLIYYRTKIMPKWLIYKKTWLFFSQGVRLSGYKWRMVYFAFPISSGWKGSKVDNDKWLLYFVICYCGTLTHCKLLIEFIVFFNCCMYPLTKRRLFCCERVDSNHRPSAYETD